MSALVTSSAAGPSRPPAEMPLHELMSHVERCDRLLKHPSLLGRLPDGGAGIRERSAAYTAEMKRRQVQQQAASSSSVAVGQQPESAEPATTAAVRLTQEEVAQAIMDQHQHDRVPVEQIVRRAYGGSLSERELQRILAEVPEGFFLTYAETVERERAAARDRRREELRKLREQASLALQVPEHSTTPAAEDVNV